jgi:aminoglycoside 2'-N-acetyltransferase I
MGVRSDRRGCGCGAAIMDALEAAIRADYELGALSATDDGARLYASRGWARWTGPTEPDGVGAVYVLPLALPVDTAGSLTADWRAGDVW